VKKPPTLKQVEAEINALEDVKPKVVHYSFFGDNNHAAIEAQIEVLTEEFDEQDCYTNQENDVWTEHETSAAVEAAQWLTGDEEEPPSKGWKEIAK
jgi:hypothetical protein